MRRTVVATVTLGLAACANPTLPFDDLEAALDEARCERLARCGGFPDADACAAFFRTRPDRDLKAAVSANITRYDAELGRLCVDALAAQPCDTTARAARVPPQACTYMLRGKRAEGAACEFDAECESRACTPTATCTPGMCCPGTCDAFGARGDEGEPCANTGDCAVDLSCSTEGVCVALAAEGDACFVDAQCDYGLACKTTTFPGECVVAAATGEACPEGRCAELGARCVDGTCRLAALGTSCTDASQCTEFADCVGNTCTAFPTTGQPCTSFCAGESYCEVDRGMCFSLLQLEEPCGAANECASFHCAEGPVFDFCAELPLCI